MDSDSPSPRQENDEPKAEFRKLTNEVATRKYRRHSPTDGSSDEEGSPRRRGLREHSKVSSKHNKYVDKDDRSYARSSSRSDYRDRESEYNRSRDHYRDMDKYYKDRDFDKTRYDGRRGSRHDDRDRRSRVRDDRDEKRDYRSYEDSRSHRSGSYAKRELGDMKDLGSSKYRAEVKSENGDRDRSLSVGPTTKRAKFSLEESDARKDERRKSGSKQGEDLVGKVHSEQVSVNGSGSAANVDAAKVAAMKAAEMVNQNLVGTGLMTADQKKKLLWGSKKSTTTEESSHHWDTSLVGDRERQEKFKKLMGVKGDVKVESKPLTSQDVEKQREVQMDLEKQYTAGLRRRDGRTVGLGL